MADTRDLKSGGSVSPPNLKSPVKSSVFQFSFPESIAQFSPEFSPVWNLQFSYAAVMESVDIVDLKFTGRNTVRVRVPSAAPWRVFLQHLKSCEDTRFFSAQTAGLSSVV